MSDLVRVFDVQQDKVLSMAPKLASHLTSSYASRFKYIYGEPEISDPTPKNEDTSMGHKLPEPFTAFKDGTHRITVIESKITTGKYGEQEELTCIDENGQTGRVWISLNSRKQIDIAAAAGIVSIDEATLDWNVLPGSSCLLVVAGGKNAAILPAPKG